MAALTLRDRFENYIASLAETCLNELGPRERKLKAEHKTWNHPAGGAGTRTMIEGGALIERLWIESSVVSGKHPATGETFYKAEFAVALYPRQVDAPAIIARLSYEAPSVEAAASDGKYSGGVCVVPNYLSLDEARHVHLMLQEVCDEYHPDFYRLFKEAADDYYQLPTRGEALGIGGLHFSKLGVEHGHTLEDRYEFVTSVGDVLIEVLLQLLPEEADTDAPSDAQRRFQEVRQGRIAEWLLRHDEAIAAALALGYPADAVLAGLPPRPRWSALDAKKASPEAELIAALRPTEWLSDTKVKPKK
jgi:coproporphyrinogen III oxidase